MGRGGEGRGGEGRGGEGSLGDGHEVIVLIFCELIYYQSVCFV